MATEINWSRVAWLDDALEVTWYESSVSHLPFLWLRDNCGCGKCRLAPTADKRFMLNQVPVNLRPTTGLVEGDELLLAWPDGHETRYSGSAIRALETQQATSWTAWDARFTPSHFEYPRFVDDDATAVAALTAFLEFGAVILTGAGSTPGASKALSRRLGPVREAVLARLHDIAVDAAQYNVAHTATALAPHTDFASLRWPPSVQALHMLVNDASGGETVIVDGWRIAEALRRTHPGYFDSLCTMPVPFRMVDEDIETHAAAPLIQLDTDGRIEALRFSNPLMQRIAPNRPGLVAFYRAYHELCRRVADDSAQATFRLQGGQMLVMAAHRVLHGRRAFSPDGRRHLQDAYFELDGARNHLCVLNRGPAALAGSAS